jgi:hypothetical protein
MTNTEWMRQRLELRAGIGWPESRFKGDAQAILRKIERELPGKRFVEGMVNRLVMGALRYGRERNTMAAYDYLGRLAGEIDKYKATGNTEHLLDAANMLLLESEFGQHPRKHFKALERKDDLFLTN